MSLNQNGNKANISAPLLATITALSNNGSGLIRCTTSAPHLFGPNDQVVVNILSPAETFGLFTINVIDSTHFDLQGSTYTTTSTGFAVDTSLTPTIQCPTDGDTFSLQLSGMLSAIQSLADRTQYLQSQMNPFGYQLIYPFNKYVSGLPSWSAWASGTAGGASFAGVPGSSMGLPAGYYDNGPVRANTRDWLVIGYDTSLITASNLVIVALGLSQQWQGAGVSNFQQVAGSGVEYPIGYAGGLLLSAQALLGNFSQVANVTTVAAGVATITGLSSMGSGCVGASLTIVGAASPGNNGTFVIASRVSASSVTITNANAVANDANNGAITTFVDNFNIDVNIMTASTGTYALNGDYQQSIQLWRPNNRMATFAGAP